MTDTMSARERIRAVLEEAYDEGIQSEYNGGPGYEFDESWVGAIIDIVREALLSEPAVTAATNVIEYRNQDPLAPQDWKEERDDWKEAVTAALDAAFGDQQP